MNNEFLSNLGEVGSRPEGYIARRKGTVGIGLALQLGGEPRRRIAFPLFTNAVEAFNYVGAIYGGTDHWEFVSSNKFGGLLPLLRKASTTCTHVTVNPPAGYSSVRAMPIEEFIRQCVLEPTEKSSSSGHQTPCWEIHYKRNKRVVYAIEGEPGVGIISLFKTEMDAEEYMNSRGLGSEWEADGPVDADNAIAFLRELSSRCVLRGSETR